jgi:hypothetical protein
VGQKVDDKENWHTTQQENKETIGIHGEADLKEHDKADKDCHNIAITQKQLL